MIRHLVAVLVGTVLIFGCDSCPPNDTAPQTWTPYPPSQTPTPTSTPDTSGSAEIGEPPSAPVEIGAADTPTPAPEVNDTPGEVAGNEPRKVAVLIAAEYSTAPLVGNEEFWYDTVLTYCMLRQNGFKDKEIYVLYGNGQDGFYTMIAPGTSEVVTPDSNTTTEPKPGEYFIKPYCGGLDVNSGMGPLWVNTEITDFPMTYNDGTFGCRDGRCRPQEMFDCLAQGCEPRSTFNTPGYPEQEIAALGESDFLFVWWKGHGVELDDKHFLRVGGYDLEIAEINGWMKGIGVGQQLLVFETCHSGCLVEEMDLNQQNEPPAIFLASSECEEYSTTSIQHGMTHGVWSYWVAGTLQGTLPPGGANPIYPDSAEPLTVELSRGGPLDKTYVWSEKATHREARTGGEVTQNPVMRDVATPALASRTHINVDDPVGHAASMTPPAGGPE